MATSLISFRPVGIRACSASGHRKSDPRNRKPTSSNWWTPLFGWSSDPDYIGSNNNDGADISAKSETESQSDADRKPSRARFSRGCLTEEKAKLLRMMTKETESFHDVMYHSAIASRLASDFSNRTDH